MLHCTHFCDENYKNEDAADQRISTVIQPIHLRLREANDGAMMQTV
jgi:hypothetical protein